MPLQRTGRSAPQLTALDDPIDDFQTSSLRVFQSKELWSQFQAELSAENVTNPSAVRMKLRQFIAEREEELIAADGGVLESEARGRQVRRGSGFDGIIKD
jgi:hypothetical protein